MIIKKKLLKNIKFIVENNGNVKITELVDSDGTPIEGDETNMGSEIESAKTTDAVRAAGVQQNTINSLYGGVGGYPMNVRVESDEAEDELVENVNSDLDGNTIPDINDLSSVHQKPIVVNKCNEFISSVNKNGLNGEQTGIALYYILSNLNVNQLPDIYKNNIKNLFN